MAQSRAKTEPKDRPEETTAAPGSPVVADKVTAIGGGPVDIELEEFLASARAANKYREERKTLLPTLDDKIAYLQCAMRPLKRNGKNVEDGWSYASIDVVVEAVKRYQGLLGLRISFKPLPAQTVIGSVTLANGRPAQYVKAVLAMRIVDLDSREESVDEIEGIAWDANGKAHGQAITFARRIALFTLLNLTTEEEVKNEGDRNSQRLGDAAPDMGGTEGRVIHGAVTPPDPASPPAPAPAPAAGASTGTIAADPEVELADLFGGGQAGGGADGGSSARGQQADDQVAEQAEVFSRIATLLPQKNKTLKDANEFVRKLTKNTIHDLTMAPLDVMRRVADRLDKLPDHVIAFTDTAAA